jgi:predicted ATPase
MAEITFADTSLTGLSKINVLLGKNGSGKSTLLKKIETHLTQANNGEINYVTPERGGNLEYDAGVEQNIANTTGWEKGQKRKNQWNQYKNYIIAQYRNLELLSLREIEKNPALRNDLTYTFESIIEKINSLLTNIKIARTAQGAFEIFENVHGTKIRPLLISSGESELIALAIECLTFDKKCEAGKENYLLLDEPDVHLHPDLQANFILFLRELVNTNKFSVIIATHSTAILGALLDYPDARFAILNNGSSLATFKAISNAYENILPIFGAHPLSNLFNKSPILLVEGEDEVRIYQQAIRTSNGRLRLYPCEVGGLPNMFDYETSVIEIISGVYDDAKAYSLRDRDDGDEIINDILPIIRMKLSCRASENLMLSDEVLATLETPWEPLQLEIEKWIQDNPHHPKFGIMNAFKEAGYPRKSLI